MAEKSSGPPVLDGSKFFVHPTFSKQERRTLTARIQFFSGGIVRSISRAEYIILPETTPVAGLDLKRVWNSDWVEDLLKEKLGSTYSNYLDLPTVNSSSESEHDIPVAAQTSQSKMTEIPVVMSSEEQDEGKSGRGIEQASPTDQSVSRQMDEINENNATASSFRKRKRHVYPGCWRRRPKVLVPDSDPSQTASSGKTNVQSTQSSAPPRNSPPDNPRKARAVHFPPENANENLECPSRPQTQSSASTSQKGSRSQESDEDYEPANRSFDEWDDDSWSENSFSEEEEEDELESLPILGVSQVPTSVKRRHSFVQEGNGARDHSDQHLTAYCERAVHDYGTQSQTEFTQGGLGTQDTQESHVTDQPLSGARSRRQEQRHQLLNCVLSLLSHWTQRPLPVIRDLWRTISANKRTFDELQKLLMTRDLSSTKGEYDATGSFTQPDGPARKKRRTIAPSLRRVEGEVSGDGGGDGSGSEVFFGGQPLEVRAQAYGGLYDTPLETDDDDNGPPPIQFRQTHLWPSGSLKSRYPYPTGPDREWVKRICRVLAALYGVSRASKVYKIWEELDGDAGGVESVLKETREVREFGLGDIPRPWS